MDLRQRVLLLADVKDDPIKQAKLMELCSRDPVFWFNTFCWTYNPRLKDAEIPFNLYPVQEWFVREIVARIEAGEEWGVEKARDMGVSWMIILTYQWFWLFRPGSSFLVGSRSEDEVDSSGAGTDTLFGKLEFNLERLPFWMVPPYGRAHRRLENKKNRNTINGSAPTPKFGRGPRATAVALDELAFWPWADASYGACSQTGPRNVTSTPYGNNNRYAQLMNDPRNTVQYWPDAKALLEEKGMLDRMVEAPEKPSNANGYTKLVLRWEDMPGRDMDWYKAQCDRMTEDEVARELDRNYSLSVSGRVFGTFKKERHSTARPITPSKNSAVYRIWDFGKTNCVIYGQIDTYGRRRVLHERLLEKSETTTQISVAKADSEQLFSGCHFIDICDPSGSYDDGRGADTHVKMLQDAGINPRFSAIQEIPPANRKRRARTMLEADLSRLVADDFAFIVYVDDAIKAGCPVTLEALQGGYCYKKDSNGNILDTIKEEHPYEDVMDCLFYWYLETQSTQDIDPSNFKAYGAVSYYDSYRGRTV